MASGANINTPATTAIVPVSTSSMVVIATPSVDFARVANLRHTVPAAMKATDNNADRCTRVGRGGRPDNADTVGTRDAVRAGHQAAPAAATTAKAMPISTSHHGTLKGSMRDPTEPSIAGATANHPASPMTA